MTVKDWVYLAITMGGYLVAVIAGLYAKSKTKINRATAAGKVMDVVGQLATYAVHEAERTEMSGAGKRKWAAEAVAQGLDWLGVKDVTPIAINGAIEDAVSAMHLANSQQAADQPAEAKQQAVDQPAASKKVADQPVADQPAASKEEA
ncbi:phage holin [Lactobacillus delbrueckii subsp. bulgaricus]